MTGGLDTPQGAAGPDLFNGGPAHLLVIAAALAVIGLALWLDARRSEDPEIRAARRRAAAHRAREREVAPGVVTLRPPPDD